MRDTVYQEYKQTIHYSNRTGVRAVCSRLPRAQGLGAKMAPQDPGQPGSLGARSSGTIDTPKFEAKRRAGNARMGTDERPVARCRNCHSFEGMNPEKQKLRAAKMHKIAQEDNKTCIDCH